MQKNKYHGSTLWSSECLGLPESIVPILKIHKINHYLASLQNNDAGFIVLTQQVWYCRNFRNGYKENFIEWELEQD